MFTLKNINLEQCGQFADGIIVHLNGVELALGNMSEDEEAYELPSDPRCN